jgi:hypothetical protein
MFGPEGILGDSNISPTSWNWIQTCSNDSYLNSKLEHTSIHTEKCKAAWMIIQIYKSIN